MTPFDSIAPQEYSFESNKNGYQSVNLNDVLFASNGNFLDDLDDHSGVRLDEFNDIRIPGSFNPTFMPNPNTQDPSSA